MVHTDGKPVGIFGRPRLLSAITDFMSSSSSGTCLEYTFSRAFSPCEITVGTADDAAADAALAVIVTVDGVAATVGAATFDADAGKTELVFALGA
jgi:hypothetical protein